MLLRQLSQIRKLSPDKWDSPVKGIYKRVLPHELISVLAYEPLYVCVYNYAFACHQDLGMKLHTWELQYLLWALSMSGTNVQCFASIAPGLCAAVFPIAMRRRAPALL